MSPLLLGEFNFTDIMVTFCDTMVSPTDISTSILVTLLVSSALSSLTLPILWYPKRVDSYSLLYLDFFANLATF